MHSQETTTKPVRIALAFVAALFVAMSACAALVVEMDGATVKISNTNASPNHLNITLASTTQALEVPVGLDGSLASGVVIRLESLDFGSDGTSSYNGHVFTSATQIKIVRGGVAFVSKPVVHDSVNQFPKMGGNTDRLVYSFEGMGCVLAVGQSYQLFFLDESGAEMSYIRYAPGTDADTVLTATTATSGGHSYTPLFQLTGKLSRSININFTSGTSLGTESSVGLYAVAGSLWDNMAAENNGSLTTLHMVAYDGTRSEVPGAGVAISGTRGSWYCSGLSAAADVLHGYVDDNAGNPTPTVTVTGIPFDRYRVVVYHSTDMANAQFGYDLINGLPHTGVSGRTTLGTRPWGDAGAADGANAIEEGVNCLVSDPLDNDASGSLVITSHSVSYRASNGGVYQRIRSGMAAVQIVDASDEPAEDVSSYVSGRLTSSYGGGVWSMPADIRVADKYGYGGFVTGSRGIEFSLGTSTARGVAVSVLADVPESAVGAIAGIKAGERLVQAVYNGDGSFAIAYDGSTAPQTSWSQGGLSFVGAHVYTLVYYYDVNSGYAAPGTYPHAAVLYMDGNPVAYGDDPGWTSGVVNGIISIGSDAEGGQVLSGMTVYAADTYFSDNISVSDAAPRVFAAFGGVSDGYSLARQAEHFTHLANYGDTEGLEALWPHRTTSLGQGHWESPVDASLADAENVGGLTVFDDGVQQILGLVETNAVAISVLAELPAGVQGAVSGFRVANGNSVHQIFAFANGDGTFKICYDNNSASGSSFASQPLDVSGFHVWTLAFDANNGAKFYRDGTEVASDSGIKWTATLHKVAKCVTVGNSPDGLRPVKGMKIYAAHTDFWSGKAIFDKVPAATAATLSTYDFLGDFASLDFGTKLSMFDNYAKYGFVGTASINGEEVDLARSVELVSLFGAKAITDGVTFGIGGIDVSDGTLRLNVSPAVVAGNSLSVFGKAELGDRWRRLKVNPEGSSVSMLEEDLAGCRFFQIRAELGEKGVGYPVSENPSVGDVGATESQSHFSSSEAGGTTVLFTFSLDGGTDGDYKSDYYGELVFQVEGVAAGAVATLSTNGMVAAFANVGENGSAVFGKVPPLKSGMALSFGIVTTNSEGWITTENLDEKAGVLSYAWGDSVANEVSGGITNTMTMLANKPIEDEDGDIASHCEEGPTVNGMYRIPAVAKSTNGVLVAVYDCRYVDGDDLPNEIDLVENWSCDGGVTWTKPRIAVDVLNKDNGRFTKSTNIGDPCILYDPAADRFWVMGITGYGLRGSDSTLSDVVLCSRGTGKNSAWSTPVSVQSQILDALRNAGETATADTTIRGVLQGPGHGFAQRNAVFAADGETILVPPGALVFPMQYFPANSNYEDSRTFALYSVDGGKTWKATKLTPVDFVAQENCITELDDGSWYMIAKGYSRELFRTTNYVEWVHVGNLSPSCWVQGSCLRIGIGPDGCSRYVAAFTTSNSPERRSHLVLHFGRDTTASNPGGKGVEWDCGERDIFPEASGGMSYNSLVMLDGRTLGVVFEAHGHIYLRKVDVKALLK